MDRSKFIGERGRAELQRGHDFFRLVKQRGQDFFRLVKQRGHDFFGPPKQLGHDYFIHFCTVHTFFSGNLAFSYVVFLREILIFRESSE